MADEVVGRGVIEVEVNDSGVDAGIARIEKTVDNLGIVAAAAGKKASEGLNKIGEGGSKVASQVDRTTKNLADSIQRTTAAMSAGAKGTAQYYEALAKSRGVNVAALKPYLDQLRDVTQQTQLAAQANKRLQQSTDFLNGLKSQAAAIGKTKSELLSMRAAELGVSDAARPMIRDLEKAERAANNTGKAFGGNLVRNLAAVAAGYLSLRGAIGLFNDSINDLAALDDMAQKTGSAVEGLSRMQKVAQQFGADFDGSVNAALNKLAKGMNGVDEEGSKVVNALNAIGISSEFIKTNDPSAVFVETAKRLQNYSDGAAKAALVTDLFGKSGAELLPYLNDLAENFDRMNAVSAVSAARAAEFQDKLGGLKVSANEVFQKFSLDLLPTLTDVVDGFGDAYDNSNKLAGESNVGPWADSVAIGFARLADVLLTIPRLFSAVSSSFQVVGQDIMALSVIAENTNPVTAAAKVARGQNPLDNIAKQLAERERVLNDANQRYSYLWNTPANQLEQAVQNRINFRREYQGNFSQNAMTVQKAYANYPVEIQRQAMVALAQNSGFTTGSPYVSPASGRPQLNYQSVEAQNKDKASVTKEAESFAGLQASIRLQAEQNRLELALGEKAAESQKIRIKLDQELAAGKVKLTAAHQSAINAEIDALAASEKALKAAQLTREITQYVEEGTVARKNSAAQLALEYDLYGKSNDAREMAIVSMKAQAAGEAEIARLKKEGYELSESQIQQLKDEAKARGDVEQATLGQTRALTYAKQLADENRRFSTEYIYDGKARAKALLDIDAEVWQERIRLAGDGTEAQKKLQQEYNTWYANQLNKPALDEWRKSVEQYDDIFRKGFAIMVNGGTDTWKSFTTSLKTTFKTSVVDYIYKALARPFVVKIVASLLGIAGGGAGISTAAAATGGLVDAAGGGFGGLSDLLGIGKSLTSGFSGIQGALTSSIEKLGAMLATGNGGLMDSLGGFIGANAGSIGNMLPFAGAALQALTGDIKGAAFTGIGSAIGLAFGMPAVGGAIGGLVGSLFGGKDIPLVGSQAKGVYQGGEFLSTSKGKLGDKDLGVSKSLSGLNQAFASQLGSLLGEFGLDDRVKANSAFRTRTNVRGFFGSSFAGGKVYSSGKYSKDVEEGFQEYLDEVLGPVLVQAIRKSSLSIDIKSLFDGISDKAQVQNMISAAVGLKNAEEDLAGHYNLTADAAARVSRATGLVGDQLAAFVGKLTTAATSLKKPSEVLLEARDSLQNSINEVFGTVVQDAVWQTVARQVEVPTAAGRVGNLPQLGGANNPLNGFISGILPAQKQFKTVTEQVLTYVDRVIPKMTALPTSLKGFDELLKSINTETAAGAKIFADIFSLREGFVQFRGVIDGLKGNVESAVFSMLSPAEQKAKREAEFAKVFEDLDIPIPGNLQELIALGNEVLASLDNPTEKMLDLAAAFPTLVEAFNETRGVIDSLTDSVKGTEFFKDLLDFTRYSKLVANQGKTFADRNTDFSGRRSQFDIPGFADGGFHQGGFRLVGERGMELEATGPARIYSATQTKALLSSKDPEVVNELRALRTLLQQMHQDGHAETLGLLMKVDRIAKGIEQLVGDGFMPRTIDNDGQPIVQDVRVVE